MSKIKLLLGWTPLFAVTLSLLACAPRLVPVGAPRGGMITQTEDTAQVRAALSRALLARRFTIESETEGHIVARFDHRGVMVRVDIEYGPDSYRIGYAGSDGLGYQVDPQSGQPVISPHYARYLARLDSTIVSELGRPERDAVEALEEAREAEQEVVARQERDERRAARQERRAARRADWMEIERERQATERERLRADAARSEVEAERLRRQPPPQFQQYQGEPVIVERFSFQADEVQSDSVSLSPGFMPDPYGLSGRATGRVPSRNLGLPDVCPGFWSRQPQHYVTLPQGMRYLRVDVSANADTTLAVVTPDGQVWCDDDSAGGTDPRLAGQFPAGTYAIYVGTYERNQRTRYSLSLSELAPTQRVAVQNRGVQSRVQANTTQVAPDCRTVLFRQGHDASGAIYCRDVEPYCAEALLVAGHNPTGLIYCRNVEPRCAVELLRSGQNPTGLIHCRP